jgi:hypothetical protein
MDMIENEKVMVRLVFEGEHVSEFGQRIEAIVVGTGMLNM